MVSEICHWAWQIVIKISSATIRGNVLWLSNFVGVFLTTPLPLSAHTSDVIRRHFAHGFRSGTDRMSGHNLGVASSAYCNECLHARDHVTAAIVPKRRPRLLGGQLRDHTHYLPRRASRGECAGVIWSPEVRAKGSCWPGRNSVWLGTVSG